MTNYVVFSGQTATFNDPPGVNDIEVDHGGEIIDSFFSATPSTFTDWPSARCSATPPKSSTAAAWTAARRSWAT
jgi:hypothetical protein